MSDQPKVRHVISVNIDNSPSLDEDVNYIDRAAASLAIAFSIKKGSRNSVEAQINAGIAYRLLLDVVISNIAFMSNMSTEEYTAMGQEIVDVLNRHVEQKMSSLRKGDTNG